MDEVVAADVVPNVVAKLNPEPPPVPENVRQFPPIAKHPLVMLMPFAMAGTWPKIAS